MAEDALRTSLDEKTALLREVHHRVKNNLQIVSSLLNLQADQEKSQPALAALRDTQTRVRSMALLHEMLYRTENLARINGAAYIEGLCAHLFHALGADPNRVRLDCRAAAVELGLDQAVPCGLIVNELVSNAIEHAFPEGRAGLITVELRRDADDRLALTVADDGAGFPAGFDFSRTSTLGLQLVRVLANQLKGVLRLERGRGAVFQVTFPGR
jgi:two-component sensor histidine kinase